ncbi:MAG: hypothetical protein FWD26_09085 [Treponema sp.]|nr:hypothetical protein [Treponema sp.]
MKALCFLIIALSLSACATAVREKPFTVDLRSPQIEAGEIEAQFDGFMSFGFKKDNVKVIYFPREDAVSLQYRREFTTYNQFWSSAGRQAFIEALEKYNEDYEERNLERSGRRTRRNYGAVQGYLIWQMYSFTVQAKANMGIDLGYQFRDRAPFFTVSQREAVYKEEQSRENRTSQVITMYFTRAQAAQLAAMFETDFLTALEPAENNTIPQIRTDRDYY